MVSSKVLIYWIILLICMHDCPIPCKKDLNLELGGAYMHDGAG